MNRFYSVLKEVNCIYKIFNEKEKCFKNFENNFLIVSLQKRLQPPFRNACHKRMHDSGRPRNVAVL